MWTEEDKRVLEVEAAHQKLQEKHSKVRELLADANLELSNALRIVDEVPTRTELIQYERRFEELYRQVNINYGNLTP